MKKADGKAGVGLTEITILGSKVPSATSSEISIQVDGKKLEHFNPYKTDYYIPQSSKENHCNSKQQWLGDSCSLQQVKKVRQRLILKLRMELFLKNIVSSVMTKKSQHNQQLQKIVPRP